MTSFASLVYSIMATAVAINLAGNEITIKTNLEYPLFGGNLSSLVSDSSILECRF